MNECKPLTLEDFDRLDESFRFETTLDATPERVFEVFEDPESWPIWARAIQTVTWTSPKPFAVGTTRDVDIVGGLVAYESRSRMRYVSPLLRPAVRLFMARIVKGLERYVSELPPPETASTPSREARACG